MLSWSERLLDVLLVTGSLPFEWIERAGSYMAPLALYYLMITKK
jgi:hypothetical protein